MYSEQDTVQADTLKHFEPLSSFPRAQRDELLTLGERLTVSSGELLYDSSTMRRYAVYLLVGSVQIERGDGTLQRVDAGSEESRHSLTDLGRRRVMALTPARLLRLDNELVDLIAAWDQLAVRERRSGARAGDHYGDGIPRRWRHGFHPLLRKISPARADELFDSFDLVGVSAGEAIILQGQPARSLFVLDSGTALQTRESRGAGVEVETLIEGSVIGMEAVDGADRSYRTTVSMHTDGLLLRLDADQYRALLPAPAINWLSFADARAAVAAGAQWLDVRHRAEWRHARLPGAKCIPLQELRVRMLDLDPAVTTVCCCSTGQRSAAAAHLLGTLGYRVSALRGGLLGQRTPAQAA